MKAYRLTIWSNFEEDQEDDQPFTVDYFSMLDAFNARDQYSEERLLNGQLAYGVVGPKVVDINYGE